MKKRFLLYFIIGCFLWMPNVFGTDDAISVCDYDCDFYDLDDALYEASDYDGASINVYGGNYTISNDHTFNKYFTIVLVDGDVSIDGEGSTIYTNYGFGFYGNDDGYDLEISNLNFESDYFDTDEYLVYIEYFNNVNLSNINIINDDPDFYAGNAGLRLVSIFSTKLENVNVEGFTAAIVLEGNKITITNSKLDGCSISMISFDSNVKIENTNLSFLEIIGGSLKMNLSENKNIIYRYFSEHNYEETIYDMIDAYEDGEYEDIMYIAYPDDFPFYGKISKTITIDSDEINLLDTWFGNDDFRLSDFDIENTNSDVVSISNGLVKPLKNGTSVVKLIDKDTDNEYILNITVNKPNPILPNVNPKTFNSILIYGLLFILMVSSGLFVLKKKH